jgi:alkylhydroperoxidase family enzyme
VLHAIEDQAVIRLRCHFDDVAVHVELPAVIEAAQTAILVAREQQRRPPVRAVFVKNSDAALAVAKHHKVLAQQTHLDRRAVGLGDLLRQAGRDPVTAHDLAHRRIALDAAQQVVFLGSHHDGASLARDRDSCRVFFLRYLR